MWGIICLDYEKYPKYHLSYSIWTSNAVEFELNVLGKSHKDLASIYHFWLNLKLEPHESSPLYRLSAPSYKISGFSSVIAD